MFSKDRPDIGYSYLLKQELGWHHLMFAMVSYIQRLVTYTLWKPSIHEIEGDYLFLWIHTAANVNLYTCSYKRGEETSHEGPLDKFMGARLDHGSSGACLNKFPRLPISSCLDESWFVEQSVLWHEIIGLKGLNRECLAKKGTLHLRKWTRPKLMACVRLGWLPVANRARPHQFVSRCGFATCWLCLFSLLLCIEVYQVPTT